MKIMQRYQYYSKRKSYPASLKIRLGVYYRCSAAVSSNIVIIKPAIQTYHLNNREAKRELDVFVDHKRLVFQQAPKYIGVRLDRMLNFKQHLEEVAGKITSRVSLIRRLAGKTWGASAKTLRISTQALVF